MGKDYTTYTTEQLLNDDFFLQSELHPTEESRHFWQNLQEGNQALTGEIEYARFFLHTLKLNSSISSLSDSEENTLWQRIEQINKSADQKKKQIRIIRQLGGIAASISLLIGIGWYASQHTEMPATDYLSIIQSAPQPDSSSQKVQLVLSNNQKLAIEGEESQLEYKKEGQVNVNSEKVDLAEKDDSKEAFNQLIVPVGKRSSVTFADGTKIWVNSGSKVIYPVKFSDKKREIFVEGEIFLHVSHDEQKPFIVKTRQMDIKVLGTQFNVTAYENETNTQVVLVSGKVEVKLGEKSKNILAPNEMFQYNSESHKGQITQVDANDYIAWKEGYYPFHQEPLRVILKKLSRYYGVQIYCNKAGETVSCSGKLDLKDNLEEVLTALKKAIPLETEKKYESIEIKVKH